MIPDSHSQAAPDTPAPQGLAPSSASSFDDGAVGVYLHLPFCERICPYCDFAVVAARPLSAEVEANYVETLLSELSARQHDFPDRSLGSVYLGGGTPSLFRAGSIERLLRAVGDTFEGGAVETTLELNPSTVELSRLPDFRAAGVNRLSIGIQSFDDRQLKRLGRAHRAAVARETLEAARGAGFDNLSIDLIFAGPDQTLEELDRDLEEVLAWSPEHVSTYELTYESETPFGRALASGRMQACDEDLAAEMILHIQSRLESAQYERYEISSYARPDRQARHNSRYWRRQAVLGLGLGAHSTEARSATHPHGARRANPRTLTAWQSAVARDPGAAGEVELLSVAESRCEAVFLALRQREGLAAAGFESEFGAPPRRFFEAPIDSCLSQGWLEESEDGDLRLSAQGRLLADSVSLAFMTD